MRAKCCLGSMSALSWQISLRGMRIPSADLLSVMPLPMAGALQSAYSFELIHQSNTV